MVNHNEVVLSAPPDLNAADARPVWQARQRVVFVAVMLTAILATNVFGEKIDVGDGLGWDGADYAVIVKDPWQRVLVLGDGIHHIQRLLPLVSVHYLFRALGIPLTNTHIVTAFLCIATFALIASIWLWLHTADLLGLSQYGLWIGGIGSIGSFAVLKWLAFYPVLTDSQGFVLGSALLYAYLARQPWLLFVLTAVSAFTWPAAVYTGAILFIFPRPDDRQVDAPFTLPWFVTAAFGCSAAVAVVGYILYLLRPDVYPTIQFNKQAPDAAWLPLSLAFVFAYLTVALTPLAAPAVPMLLTTLRRDRAVWRRLGAIGVMLGAIWYAQVSLALPGGYREADVFPHMMLLSVIEPGAFFVSHAVFFGPVVVLTALLWPAVCRSAASLGLGLLIVLAATVVLSLGSESRRLFNFVPVAVALTAMAADRRGWRGVDVVLFGTMSLVASKIWLPIGSAEIPSPRLFMNLGPWMQPQEYIVQGVAVLVITAVLYAQVAIGAHRRASAHPE
ncbi:MAG: hypothetical protein IT305_18185 [Chloroflexi bacterium]|nr:hypothetical protein [Chloroflexota bacterium]